MTSAPSDKASAAAAALADALAAVQQFATIDGWQLASDELAASLVALDGLARRVSAQSARVVAEADSRGLPAENGHGRPAGWVRQVVPTMSRRDAATLGRRATELFNAPTATDLSATRTAVLSGAVGLDHADVLTSTLAALQPPEVPAGLIDADTLDEAQTYLVEQSQVFDASKLRRLAAYLRHRLDPGADDRLARDEEARERARALTIHPLTSGMVHLQGTLTPECGAALGAAIDAWSAPHPAADGTPDPRTPSQRRHDGLARLAATAITDPDLLPTSHGSPYRILVTVPQATFAAAVNASDATGPLPAALPDGNELSSTALQKVGCDAEVVPILIDDLGNPLDVGDTQYAFPPRQRTAITHRDQHCTWPGCTAPPPWCDIHHLTPFSQGGPTAVTNGALLCGRHHRHVHTTHQTGRLLDGHITWDTSPPDSPPTQAHLTRAQRALDHLVHRYLTRRRR